MAALLLGLALAGCDTAIDREIAAMRDAHNGLSALDVDHSVNPLEVGHRLMQAQEYELALRAYQRAVDRTGLTYPTLVGLGTASQKTGRLLQAKRYLESATELAPGNPVGWNNLGVVHMELRSYHEARDAFFTAFALDSGESPQIRLNYILAEQKIAALAAPDVAPADDFSLVRHGHGRYVLDKRPQTDPTGGP